MTVPFLHTPPDLKLDSTRSLNNLALGTLLALIELTVDKRERNLIDPLLHGWIMVTMTGIRHAKWAGSA